MQPRNAITIARSNKIPPEIPIEEAKLSHGRSVGRKWIVESQEKIFKSVDGLLPSREGVRLYRSGIFSVHYSLYWFSKATLVVLLFHAWCRLHLLAGMEMIDFDFPKVF